MSTFESNRELGLSHLLNLKCINEVPVKISHLNGRFAIKVFIEKKMAMVCLFDAEMENEFSPEKGVLFCNKRNRISTLTQKTINESVDDLKNIIKDIRLDAIGDLTSAVEKVKENNIKTSDVDAIKEKAESLKEIYNAEKVLDSLIKDGSVQQNIFIKIKKAVDKEANDDNR